MQSTSNVENRVDKRAGSVHVREEAAVLFKSMFSGFSDVLLSQICIHITDLSPRVCFLAVLFCKTTLSGLGEVARQTRQRIRLLYSQLECWQLFKTEKNAKDIQNLEL